MTGLTYYEDLENAFKRKMRVALETEPQNYIEDASDALAYITGKRNMHVVYITFDLNTRDIFDKTAQKGGNIDKICVVDTVSITEGKGSPPVAKIITINSPVLFDEIFIYAHMFLKQYRFRKCCVFFFGLERLLYYERNINEIALFLTVFGSLCKRTKIPEIFMMHNAFDMGMTQILSNEAQRTIKIMRKLVYTRKMLIIDDEMSDLGVLKLLERDDFSLTIANSGEKAIEELGKRFFDGIIVNINMNSLSDKQLLKIREYKEKNDTILLFASLSKRDKNIKSIDGFLRRPFSPETISADVRKFFGKKLPSLRKQVFDRKEEKPKILVIDNEMTDLKIFKQLKKQGFAVSTAVSGKKALQEIAKRPFDCVIVNIDMQTISEKQLLKIMEYKKEKPVKIIFASENKKETGDADGFLKRPFSPETTSAEIMKFLKKNQ